MTQTIPTLVITPVIVLIFGYGDVARLFTVILVCFFPITVSLFHGLKAVDYDMIRLMRTMGGTTIDILRHVKIPASIPALFSGLKILTISGHRSWHYFGGMEISVLLWLMRSKAIPY